MEYETYYLDNIGYNDYLQRVNILEERLKSFNATRADKAKKITLDEKYSTAEASDLARKEKSILEELQDLRKKGNQIQIIEKHGDDTKTDIGDRLLIEIMYAPDDIEELEVEITATISSSIDNEDKVSINSPLGRALYSQVIGGIYTYQVGERKMAVHIKQKLLTEDKPVERK
jgi:transcription elongation GreA/GreB family factor